MSAPPGANAIANRLNETALRGGWSWTGWVALRRLGLLERDVLASEPLTLLVPAVDLDDAVDVTTASLAADGWGAAAMPTHGLDRLLAVTTPDADAGTTVLLRGSEPPLDVVHVAGWPCVLVAHLAVGAALRVLLTPPSGEIVRWTAAIDLLATVRATGDGQLGTMLGGLAAPSRRELAGALRDIPGWLLAAGGPGARELATSRRRLLDTLDGATDRPLADVRLAASSTGEVVVEDLLVATLLGRRRVRTDDRQLLARLVEWAVWEERPELLGQLTHRDLDAVWSSLTLSSGERDRLAPLLAMP